MKRRTFLRGAVSAAACSAAAFPAPTLVRASSASPKRTVKMGVSGRPDQAFLELAIARGYFDQQGIEIEKVPATTGTEFIAPLAMDQLQVASGSPNAPLFNAFNRGINIRIVGDFAHLGSKDDGLVSIVVREDLLSTGAVKSFADLKGRRIALGTSRGQYSYVLVDTLLKANGMTWKDVNIENITFANSIAAMSNKVIDAGFMIEPLVTSAAKQGIARPLVKGGEVEAGAHLSVLLYSGEFAKDKSAATRFMTGYLRGARDYRDAFFLNKEREAAIDILVKTLPVKDRDVWRTAMPQHISITGNLNVPDIIRQAQVYASLGDVSGGVPNVAQYVDTEFAAAATKIIEQT